jgi:hypothetical protein
VSRLRIGDAVSTARTAGDGRTRHSMPSAGIDGFFLRPVCAMSLSTDAGAPDGAAIGTKDFQR